MLKVLLHHSETVDPTLVQWMRDLLGHLFGFGTWPIVVFLGAVIVVIPVWLMMSAARRQRHGGAHDQDGDVV